MRSTRFLIGLDCVVSLTHRIALDNGQIREGFKPCMETLVLVEPIVASDPGFVVIISVSLVLETIDDRLVWFSQVPLALVNPYD